MGRVGPYVARIVRVSPPELAGEFPGPQASSRVTRAPVCRRWRADHPPNAPAPTTITEAWSEAAAADEPITQAALATAEPLRNRRRELLPSASKSASLTS